MTKEELFLLKHRILHNILRSRLSCNEIKVMVSIYDKTLGYNKTEDKLPVIQITDITGIHKSHISKIIKRLVEYGLIERNGKLIRIICDNSTWNIVRDRSKNENIRKRLQLHVTNKKLQANATGVAGACTKKLQLQADSDDSSGDYTELCSPSEKKSEGELGEIVTQNYNKFLPQNPPVKFWTPARENMLKFLNKNYPETREPEFWSGLFEAIAKSMPFLAGKKAGKDGSPFFADIEWILNRNNFPKIIEGRYRGDNDKVADLRKRAERCRSKGSCSRTRFNTDKNSMCYYCSIFEDSHIKFEKGEYQDPDEKPENEIPTEPGKPLILTMSVEELRDIVSGKKESSSFMREQCRRELKRREKGDNDTIAKAVCDSLNKLAWPDDSSVAILECVKLYNNDGQGRCEFGIEPISEKYKL